MNTNALHLLGLASVAIFTSACAQTDAGPQRRPRDRSQNDANHAGRVRDRHSGPTPSIAVQGTFQGGGQTIFWSGGQPTVSPGNGPLSHGATGAINCVFGGWLWQRPATIWWVDEQKPTNPNLIYRVAAPPGSPVTGFSSGWTCIYFEVVGNNVKPKPTWVTVKNNMTQKVTVTYR